MKFKGQPDLYVRISNKYVQRAYGHKGFFFDKNGEFETDNVVLIKLMKQCFEEVKEEPIPETKEEITAVKVFKCKKCNFETTESMGALLAHYRMAKHPKS